jgi:hypothetical protein
MISSLQHLQAERQTVQGFLDEIPGDSLIERYSWQARLQVLDGRIEAEQSRVVPARSAITFQGRPVVGSHGIASAFGLAATRAYTKIVQVVAAQWYQAQPLANSRPLKADSRFDLLVVGPAFGSFGFELEEPIAEQLTIEERSVLARSLEKTQLILKGALESDEALAQTLDDSDDRTLSAVRAFLKVLGDNDATCAIQSGERLFRFESAEQIAQSRLRVEWKNIKREEVTREGQFVGARPGPRDFEFQVEGGESIAGRVNLAVADLNDINRHLYQRARVRLFFQQVGSARPRYVLVQNPEWLNEE